MAESSEASADAGDDARANAKNTEATQPQSASKSSVTKTFANNVAFAMGSRILYLVSRLMLPAIILQHVTMTEFGIWSVCFVLIANIGMSAFGLANVYVRDVAERHARGDMSGCGAVYSTGMAVVAAIALIVLPVLWFSMPWIIQAFHIPPELDTTATILIFGTVVVFMLDLSLGSFIYLIHGMQRMRMADIVWVIAFMGETVLILALLYGGAGVMSMLIAFTVRYIFSSITYYILAKRLVPELRISYKLINRETLRLFMGFGMITQLTGILSTFMRSIEKLLAGVMIGVQATGLFEIAQKFPTTAPSIPMAMNAASYPTFSYLYAQGRMDELKTLYLANQRYVAIVAALMMGYMFAFTEPLLGVWLGPTVVPEHAAFLMMVFMMPFNIDIMCGPASSLARGMGRPKKDLLYPCSQLGLIAVAVPALLLVTDALHAIAYGVAGSMIASALIYLGYMNRFIGISASQIAAQVFAPAVSAYGLGMLTMGLSSQVFDWAAASRLELLGGILVFGVLYTGAYGLLFLVGFSTERERDVVRNQSQKLLGRVLKAKTA